VERDAPGLSDLTVALCTHSRCSAWPFMGATVSSSRGSVRATSLPPGIVGADLTSTSHRVIGTTRRGLRRIVRRRRQPLSGGPGCDDLGLNIEDLDQVITCHPASVARKGKKLASDRLQAFRAGIGAI
jgi:hypothetical protein